MTEAEQEIGQRYRVEITVGLDTREAAASDDIDDTISYARIHQIAAGIMTSGPFRLIETPAEKIATAILDELPARSVIVRLRKLAPPIPGVVAAAGVEIFRERTGH